VRPQYEVSLAELAADPHALLARLRERAPVCWVPALGGWLVTAYPAAVEVLLDAATFTVDDPRFTTARVTGPSMLSLDGDSHARHRAPFTHAFRPAELSERLAGFALAEAARLTDSIRPVGQAELRTTVAGPLAAAVMTEALGLGGAGVTPGTVLSWYRDIVAAVAALSPATLPPATLPPPTLPAAAQGAPSAAGVGSFDALAASLREVIAAGRAPVLAEAAASGDLTVSEVISNAAVQLFGGIETTEGMICNAVLHLLSDPAQRDLVRADLGLLPAAVEESLRLEPAAAVVDRYATRDVSIGGAGVRRGDLVTVSLAGANRDPAIFPEPDRYDIRRPNSARHLAFARGPHFCLGAHLARLETTAAVTALFSLPGLALDPGRTTAPYGLIFRKPAALWARWG
jgi:cytochrome P450